MPAISWDDKAFIVDARKVWIVAGAIHYFRVPRELWRDRLLKLKRAGCNTLETYVAWNAHEPDEGRFDFSGMLDIDAFFTLAESLGFWIIARPGPYICSEWDNGGIPAWLNAKPGVKVRVANPVYQHYVSLFFKELIPIIAKHQVTRGGRVILVQDENEYIYRNRPGGREHLIFVHDLLRRLGIDVPIVVCNFLCERIDDTIECWNGWEAVTEGIETLRKVQPDTPKLVTEFWDGWFEAWGHKPPVVVTPRDVHTNSLRVLAHGGQYIYYMFHGGTNFGYYPGRTDGDDFTYLISSYDYTAALSETAALAEKYYTAKLASTFASNLSAFFAESEPARVKVVAPDGIEVMSRVAAEGHIIFVRRLNPQTRRADLILPGGVGMEVSFADADILALPWHFSPVPGFTVNYSNLSILGMMPMGVGRLVFLHGPSGANAVLSAQGRVFRRRVGQGTQVWFGNFPNLIAVLDTERAKRAWFLDDRIVVGPDFVGDVEGEKTEVFFREKGESAVVYFPNGRVTYATSGDVVKPPRLPRLSRWAKKSLLPSSRPDTAVRIDDGGGGFRAPETTGYFGGYAWYETTVESPRAGTQALLFSNAEDRLTVFANGRRAGTFGRGPGASIGLVRVPLRRGANRLTILLDNLGRANYTEVVGETKGIRAPAYLGARILALKTAWNPPRYNGKLANTWQIESFWPKAKSIVASLSCVFEPRPGEGAVLRVQNVDRPAALFLNGRFHSYFWGNRELSKLDMTLDPDTLVRGKNLVELCFFVDPGKAAADAVTVYAFDPACVLLGSWWFWQSEAPAAPRGKSVPSGPVAWETTFDLEKPEAPVWLIPEGLKKGEIWLNGRMVSRHWDIGPQKKVYLPEPWLTGRNKLIIVDEFGASPRKVHLEYDSRGSLSREMI